MNSKITEGTLIPLGIVGSLLLTFSGGIWWMSSLYSRVASAETSIDKLDRSREEIINELRSVNENLVELKTILRQRNELGQ